MMTPIDASKLHAELSGLAYAWGSPVASAGFRQSIDDFVVTEILGFSPDQQGEHLLLSIEKRDNNTEWIVRQLAAVTGVARRDIGYCGLKDRFAIARQWFSVPWRESEGRFEFELGDGIRVLETVRHGRKLRQGSHAGNRFELRLRRYCGDIELLEDRLRRMCDAGFPNYFGPQRFGHEAQNLVRGIDMLNGGPRPRKRQLQGLYYSAVRSFLFNLHVAARVEEASWLQVREGDLLNLDGSRSRFRADSDLAGLNQRLADGDLHVTAPLWGRETRSCPVDPAELEILGEYRALGELLLARGPDADRRAIRAIPGDLDWQRDGATVALRFTLPRGVYATSLVRELLGDQALRRNA